MTDSVQPRLTWRGRTPLSTCTTSEDVRAAPLDVRAPVRLSRATPGGSLGTTARALSTPCTLIEGDNGDALRALIPELAGQVTLAYLDPPFLTGRTHHCVRRTREEDGAIAHSKSPAFEDRWDSLGDYLAALEPRLRTLRQLLAEHGSLVLHVDPKTSHYAKVLCDEIFGPEAFSSEVIWRYRRWPAKTRNFQRVHDVMLRYVKNPRVEPRFHQLYEPLAPSTLRTWGDKKQRAVVGGSGRRVRSSTTDELSRGTPLGDVWEIGIVAPVARERTGYPTQKPEALLRRWIETCTDPGDLVLDPYMGSGTTLTVAAELGRRGVGIDLGAEAHSITRERLEQKGIPYQTRRVLVPLAKKHTVPAPLERELARKGA